MEWFIFIGYMTLDANMGFVRAPFPYGHKETCEQGAETVIEARKQSHPNYRFVYGCAPGGEVPRWWPKGIEFK